MMRKWWRAELEQLSTEENRISQSARFGGFAYAILCTLIAFPTGFYERHPSLAIGLGLSLFTSAFLRCWLALPSAEKQIPAHSLRAAFFYGLTFGGTILWGVFAFFALRDGHSLSGSVVLLIAVAGLASGQAQSFAPLFSVIAIQLTLLIVPIIHGVTRTDSLGASLSLPVVIFVYYAYLLLQAFQISKMVRNDQNQQKLIQETNDQLQASQKRTLEASKTQERFLEMMSHEIRTPLNGILGASDLILQDCPHRPTVERTGLIRLAGENLLLLLTDILNFSEFAGEKLRLKEEPFSPQACLSDAFRLFESAANRKNIIFEHFVNPDVPKTMLGDVGRVKQILVNLIGNAIKYTESGKITASLTTRALSAEDYELHFTVIDSGCGISPEKVATLFEEFVSQPSRDGGSARRGIGLSICRRLCEAMQGTIRVQSTPGSGTQFDFSVSMKKVVEVKVEKSRASLHAVGPTGDLGRILVVEDNAINQKIVITYLVKQGYEVDLAQNGLEAVHAVQKTPYVAIIMDCQMPEMDGFEATKKIRELPTEMSSTPIIALTANAMSGDREKCLNSGMDDYLTKPVRLDELRTTLEKWIKRAS